MSWTMSIPSGRQTRYVFNALKEPPFPSPDELSQLSLSHQRLHADFLARCNTDQETYHQRLQALRPRAALGSTKNYKEEKLVEEV